MAVVHRVWVGVLLWGQVVTSIPTKGLPKSLTIGGGDVQPTDGLFGGSDEGSDTHEKRSGQILWIRGLTRLQTQVIGGDLAARLIPVPMSHSPMDQKIRVVKAFQAGLDRREPSLSGPSAARLREISRQLKLQVENEGKGGAISYAAIRSKPSRNEAITSV